MNDKNNKINIWIDCDPGIDDAVALAMTAASRDALHLLGVSTVAGNQTSDRVTGNALKLTAFFGMDDVAGGSRRERSAGTSGGAGGGYSRSGRSR